MKKQNDTKYPNYKPIETSPGRHIYAHGEVYNLMKRVFKEYKSNYHMTTILRTLMTLKADAPRGLLHSFRKPVSEGSITSGNISLGYKVFDTDVLIDTLSLEIETNSQTGLYRTTFDTETERWEPKEKISHLNINQLWKSQSGKAHYAAVTGKFDDIEDAAKLMPEHIVGGYKKAEYLTKHDAGKEYSLVWIEKGKHKSNEAAEMLASIMQQSTRNNLPVNWLVHGEAIHTFKNSVKLMGNALPEVSGSILKNSSDNKVQNQSVYFSNPDSSSSEKTLKALCEKVGMTCAGMNTNYRDFRRVNTWTNAIWELGKPAVVGFAAGTFTLQNFSLQSAGMSNADKVIYNGVDSLLSSNYFGAALCAAGIAVICIGAYKKAKPVGATIRCTFGKGNERWYTNDDKLLG